MQRSPKPQFTVQLANFLLKSVVLDKRVTKLFVSVPDCCSRGDVRGGFDSADSTGESYPHHSSLATNLLYRYLLHGWTEEVRGGRVGGRVGEREGREGGREGREGGRVGSRERREGERDGEGGREGEREGGGERARGREGWWGPISLSEKSFLCNYFRIAG